METHWALTVHQVQHSNSGEFRKLFLVAVYHQWEQSASVAPMVTQMVIDSQELARILLDSLGPLRHRALVQEVW